MRAAYSTAQALMGLQRQLVTPPGQLAGDGSDSPHPTYGQHEVHSAVSELQRQEGKLRQGPPEGVGLKSRVLSALRARYGINDPRELNQDERDAIEVIENLVTSILDDALLSESIRPRMRRLELPLLNAAMQDAEFFNAPQHPARQVVNQLGQLHLADGGAVEAPIIDEQVDPLIDKIVARSDGDPGVFPEVLTDLNALVAEQAKMRDENVRQVIQQCEQQQALVRSRHTGSGATPSPRKELPEEWQQWLSRAKRLEVGDAVMLGSDSESPQRTAVAWIDEDQSTYVFVDEFGNKTASLSLQELAMQLRRGTADVLQRDHVSVVDRGLYDMLQKMHTQVASQAARDSLTELTNRKEFELRVAEAVISARREHINHTLWLMDLDNFAAVNEACGKKAGDKLLREIGRILEKRLKSGSSVCRFEGDQFGVLIDGAQHEQIRGVVEQHRRMVEKFRAMWKGERIELTASFGLVEISDQTQSAEQALDEASQACAKAKEDGGNRVEVYEEQVNFEQSDDGRSEWVGRIKKMLDENALELRCQPIVPVVVEEDSTKPHYEILLGVPDDKGHVMPPGEFIHASELYGQMPDVDRWVVRTTFEWMAANKRKLLKLGGCAINLSGQSLSEEAILSYVLEQFETSKVPPAKVLFEITESTEIGSLSNAENFINVMREYGCRFSLDDFGSSHSSYAYLKQLPVDFVKIDGMFVRDIVNSPNDYAMVKSINEIGHFMGKKTVAEFVENDEILDKLREIGVDYAQGYGVGKPQLLVELG